MEEFFIRNGLQMLILVAGLVGGYAVRNFKTESQGREIDSLKKSRMDHAADIVRLDKEVALVRQEIQANDRRASEFMASLKEAITQSEARVIQHVNRLVESLGK